MKACVEASSDCRVVQGLLSAYFPKGTDPSVVEDESSRLLETIKEEMKKDDWTGLQVTYDTFSNIAITGYPDDVDGSDPDKSGGGTGAGAIAGIVVGVLGIVGVVAIGGIMWIRHERNKNDEFGIHQQHTRQLPYGDDAYVIEDDESDSDDSDVSSSEEEDEFTYNTGSIGTPTAVSGTTYKTDMAHAQPHDLEEDVSSSDSDSSSGSEGDESQLSENELDVVEDRIASRQLDDTRLLQQSPANDDPSSVYEESGVDYRNADQYIPEAEYHHEGGTHIDDEHEGANYEDQYQQQQEHFDSSHHSFHNSFNDSFANQQEYPQSSLAQHFDNTPVASTMNEDDARSIMSSDPPGTSYRDLPNEEKVFSDQQQKHVMAPQVEHYHHEKGYDEEYYHDPQDNFHGGSQHDSYHGSQSGSHQDVDGSYHSQEDETNSNALGSQYSGHSNNSAGHQSNHSGSRHSHPREQGQYENQSNQYNRNDGQYGEIAPLQDDYNDAPYHPEEQHDVEQYRPKSRSFHSQHQDEYENADYEEFHSHSQHSQSSRHSEHSSSLVEQDQHAFEQVYDEFDGKVHGQSVRGEQYSRNDGQYADEQYRNDDLRYGEQEAYTIGYHGNEGHHAENGQVSHPSIFLS